jgi:hypothetical protein
MVWGGASVLPGTILPARGRPFSGYLRSQKALERWRGTLAGIKTEMVMILDETLGVDCLDLWMNLRFNEDVPILPV